QRVERFFRSARRRKLEARAFFSRNRSVRTVALARRRSNALQIARHGNLRPRARHRTLSEGSRLEVGARVRSPAESRAAFALRSEIVVRQIRRITLMDGQGFKFIDRTGAEQEKGKLIPAVLIKKS